MTLVVCEFFKSHPVFSNFIYVYFMLLLGSIVGELLRGVPVITVVRRIFKFKYLIEILVGMFILFTLGKMNSSIYAVVFEGEVEDTISPIVIVGTFIRYVAKYVGGAEFKVTMVESLIKLLGLVRKEKDK